MREGRDYEVLLITSFPSQIDRVTAIARRHFERSTVLLWEQGNQTTKGEVLKQIKETPFNLILSCMSGIILRRHHLDRARFGALNIHPAPPEHGGLWGLWCQPVIQRSVRAHHGVVVHEIDEKIDHGPIYRVKRWDVPEDATIRSVAERSVSECLHLLDEVSTELARSDVGTRCFSRLEERWHPTNCHHNVGDVRRWFDALDRSHPAHQERIPFNHPQGISKPPYFADA